jgi:hypothetical protein
MIKEKVGMKKAKGLIYNFILTHNLDTKRKTLYQRISRAKKVYEFTKKIGIDKIKYIKMYSANSIAELSDSQIQPIVDYFSKNPNTELPDNQEGSIINSEEEILGDQTDTSEVDDYYKMLLEDCAKDCMYFDKEVDSTSQLVKKVNEEVALQSVKTDDDSDCNRDSDSKEEMPDDSDDDGYNDYGGYNEYGERDRGYYYCDGGYKRKTSPMMSPIISLVTA